MLIRDARPLTPKLRATFSRPADNTAYTAGDHVANNGTAALVTPMTFTLERPYGKIIGARCVITPASGNLVITACDLDLLLFRPETSIPFAAAGYPADNAALTLTGAMMLECVGVISFVNTAWRNQLGALTAGTVGYQAAALTPNGSFNVESLVTNAAPVGTLLGIVQAKGAWTPTAVVNRFDFMLDVSLD